MMYMLLYDILYMINIILCISYYVILYFIILHYIVYYVILYYIYIAWYDITSIKKKTGGDLVGKGYGTTFVRYVACGR